MFWTLVAMTLSGTPMPTGLVFDSLDACYQAEKWMAGEQSRYNNERVSQGERAREAVAFARQTLGRGICVPHSRTTKVHNLSPKNTSGDPGRLHPFSPMENGSGPAVEYFIAPVLDYDLPGIPVTFRLLVKNPNRRAVDIRNPLQNLSLTFHKPDASRVDLPVRVAETPRADVVDLGVSGLSQPVDEKPLRGPSNIEFRSATVNGRKEAVERNTYRIEPGSSLEILIVCEPVVGERIVEALKNTSDKHVEVSAFLLAINANGQGVTSLRLYDKVRLQIPGPERSDGQRK